MSAWRGGPLSPSHKAKISEGLMGHPVTKEQREKIANTLAKKWLVTGPDGAEKLITNLRKFCEENKLDQGNMTKVANGDLKQHKGWLCERYSFARGRILDVNHLSKPK